MVTVRLAVGSYVNELRLRALFKSRFEARNKLVAGIEQPLESNGARGRAVVEKDRDGCA